MGNTTSKRNAPKISRSRSSNAISPNPTITSRIKKSASTHVLNKSSQQSHHQNAIIQPITPPYVQASLTTLRNQHRLILANRNLDMMPRLIREYLEGEYGEVVRGLEGVEQGTTEWQLGDLEKATRPNGTSVSQAGANATSQIPPKQNLLTTRKIIEINIACNKFSHFRYVLPSNCNFTQLEELNIGYNRIAKLPDDFVKRVPNLKRLNVAGNALSSLPDTLQQLKDLLVLDISDNDFSHEYEGKMPACVQYLTSLRRLNVSNTHLKYLSNSLSGLKHLNYLNASKNQIKNIPKSIGNLHKLTHLVLFENEIESIAPEVGRCSIRVLELDNNQLTHIPDTLFTMEDLRELYLSNNKLEAFPEIPMVNETLQVLEADSNQLTHLPTSFSNIKKLSVLTLSRNRLTEFSVTITTLSDVSLAKNCLTSFPDCLRSTPQLMRLNLSYNKIKKLKDDVFDNCLGLRQLNLTGNGLQNLPSSLVHCNQLEVLLASENAIEKIPHTKQFREDMHLLAHLSLWGNQLNYHQVLRLTSPFDYDGITVPFPRLRTLHLERNSLQDTRWNAPVVKQKFLQMVESYQYLTDFEFSSDLSAHMHHVNIKVPPTKSRFTFGSAHFQGIFRSTMEDAIAIDELSFEGELLSLFAVMDGHGGDKVSIYAAKHLPSVLQGILDKNPRNPEITTATFHLQWCVTTAINRLTEGLRQLDMLNAMTDGSTFVMALIWRRKCIVVNLGDSRAVACTRRGKKAVRLSRDHKASDPIEKKRILEMGGVVDSRERVLGLALSRSLGDFDLKPFVTHDPEFCVIELDRVGENVLFEEIEDHHSVPVMSTPTGCIRTGDTPAEEQGEDALSPGAAVPGYKFIVLACDGVFDVLQDQEVCDHVNRIIKSRREADGSNPSVDTLDLAAHHVRDFSLCCGSSDNISLIVIAIHKEDHQPLRKAIPTNRR